MSAKAISILMLILAAITAVATAASTTIQGFWADHSLIAPIVLLVYSKLALFMPSPATTAKVPGA